MTDTQNKTRVESTAETAKPRVARALDQAGDYAHAQAEAATDAMAASAGRKAQDAAEAAHAAADAFAPGSLPAQVAEQISAGLLDLAQGLRRTDLDAAARRVTGFARENPVLFLGGAALMGFAAARFLKAGSPRPEASHDRNDDPWTGHVTATPLDRVPVAPTFGTSRTAPAPQGSEGTII